MSHLCQDYRISPVFFLIVAVLWSVYGASQPSDSLTGKISPQDEFLIEDLSGTYEENVDPLEVLYEPYESSGKRLSINLVDPFELSEKLHLSQSQVQHLTEYIHQYGPLLTIYELQVIQGFDSATIHRILPYINTRLPETAFPLNPLLWIKQMSGSLILRYGRILEPQAGYMSAEDTSDVKNNYLGDPSKMLLKFSGKAGNYLHIGLTAEKDAGEQFFTGTQKQGFDHYAAYMMMNVNKILKTVIIGDYHLRFGQGLSINTSGLMTSNRGLYQPYRFSSPVRPNSSSNEYGGLRGIATCIQTGKIGWTLFFSGNKMDARFENNDTSHLSLKRVKSIITSGYHRTTDEINNKEGILNLLYGGHVNFKNHFIQIGFTGFQTTYNAVFSPQTELYKRFDPMMQKMIFMGIDFRLLLPHVMVFGEMTHHLGHKMGCVMGMFWYAHPRFKHTVVYRHYPAGFNPPFASALGLHQTNTNEYGISQAIEVLLSKRLTLTAGADVYRIPWLSYRLDKPSTGTEFYLLTYYRPTSGTQFNLRYVCKTGEKNPVNGQGPVSQPLQINAQQWSLQFLHSLSAVLSLKNQLYISTTGSERDNRKTGYLISLDIQYSPINFPLEATIRYALFDTDGYTERIYAYERDVLFAFSAPAYYSKGTRIYVLIRYAFGKRLDVWMRFARTAYFQQTFQSSGSDGNVLPHKSEIKIQVRYRF